jgi:hypothetical protein
MKKLLLVYFVFSFYHSKGQGLDSSGSFHSDAPDVTRFYFANQRQNLAIHNGRVFYGYPGMINHAFFPEEGWQKGSLLYDDIWYREVSLMYDIYKDEVVILHPNNTPIRLFSERIDKFNFNGQHFVRLKTGKDNHLKSGFYQQLIEGNVTIFARREKKMEENIVGLVIERQFIAFDRYYVLKGDKYYTINKQKDLLELLKDEKQNIVQQLKKQKLKFKRNKEKTIVTIAQLYNQLHK